MRLQAGFLLACALVQGQEPMKGQAFQLPNGLKCVLFEKHDQPLIRVELVTRWQLRPEPAAMEGLPALLAALLRVGGAGSSSRVEFDQAVDDLGLSLGFQGSRNAFRWTLATDSRTQEPAFELLADTVFRPVFDMPLVEAQRRVLLAQVAALSPEQQFLRGLGDPEVECPLDPVGLEGVGFETIQAFRRRVLRPEGSTLAIHGDLSLSQAKDLVFLHFGLWGPEPQPPLGKMPQRAPAPRFLVAQGQGSDVELWAGREPGACSPAVEALLGILLERGLPGRSTQVTRTCSLGPGRPFLLKVKAGTGAGLEAALLGTLERLRNHCFTALDLERARLQWKARFGALALHPRDLLRRFQEGSLEPGFSGQVEAVGVEELNTALRTLLAPESLHFLLLGGDGALVRASEKAGFGPATPVKSGV